MIIINNNFYIKLFYNYLDCYLEFNNFNDRIE